MDSYKAPQKSNYASAKSERFASRLLDQKNFANIKQNETLSPIIFCAFFVCCKDKDWRQAERQLMSRVRALQTIVRLIAAVTQKSSKYKKRS